MENESILSFTGTVRFECNIAKWGGAMLIDENSKLILKPKLSISFVLNHVYRSGGALYFSDSQCSFGSTVPIECFITIDSPFASVSESISNISHSILRMIQQKSLVILYMELEGNLTSVNCSLGIAHV